MYFDGFCVNLVCKSGYKYLISSLMSDLNYKGGLDGLGFIVMRVLNVLVLR